ncbi:MAG: DUF4124 domain-containing protein [Caldimonas sp.]
MTGVVAAVALLALPAQAQWKWRDSSGHVQYSDLPPPSGTPDKDILNRPVSQRHVATLVAAPASAASAAASNALAPRTTDPELEARRKKAEAEQAAKLKADEARVAAGKAENCNRAKGQLNTLTSGVRMARVNDKGEREFLDDNQRATQTRQAQDAISSNCK